MTACPRCGAAIGRHDIDVDLRLMRCNACDDTFRYEVTPPAPSGSPLSSSGPPLSSPDSLLPPPWPLRSWEEGDDLVVRHYPIGDGVASGAFWVFWTAITTFILLIAWLIPSLALLVLAALFTLLGLANIASNAWIGLSFRTLRVGPAGVRVRVWGRETMNVPLERVLRVETLRAVPTLVAKGDQTFELLPVRSNAAIWLVAAVARRLGG